MGATLGLFLFVNFFDGNSSSSITKDVVMSDYFNKGYVKELILYNADAKAEAYLTKEGK